MLDVSPVVVVGGVSGDAIPGPMGPRGEQGPQGPQGEAASITVGEVTILAPGEAPAVENKGTSSNAVLDFSLPEGISKEELYKSFDFNCLALIMASSSFTVPHTGLVKATIVGGGGAGSSCSKSATNSFPLNFAGNLGRISSLYIERGGVRIRSFWAAGGLSGGMMKPAGASVNAIFSAGGSAGEVLELFLFLQVGDICSAVIGAGGTPNGNSAAGTSQPTNKGLFNRSLILPRSPSAHSYINDFVVHGGNGSPGHTVPGNRYKLANIITPEARYAYGEYGTGGGAGVVSAYGGTPGVAHCNTSVSGQKDYTWGSYVEISSSDATGGAMGGRGEDGIVFLEYYDPSKDA